MLLQTGHKITLSSDLVPLLLPCSTQKLWPYHSKIASYSPGLCSYDIFITIAID